jgi:ketosteroid isomerase-like protein
MKSGILVALLMLSFTAQAQTPLQEMVLTEQAFSRMAAEKNTRDAFMAYIADDGLLFRPEAVNGKKWMLEHPVPPSDKRPLLAWQPAFAGMAAAGDLGFTTGPWESKPDINDEKPSAYGHFVTVWKKQPDGSWKFVVDLGISHPQSGGPQTLWKPEDKTSTPRVLPTVDVAAERKALLKRDRDYSEDSLKNGLVNAFQLQASPNIRVYRNGSLPVIGRDEAVDLIRVSGGMGWTPRGGDVSRSADLGYTYGVYDITDNAKKVVEHGSYVRIWKREQGGWRVVLDVTNPRQ